MPKTKYAEPDANSPAVACRDASGDLRLYHVAGEIPVTDVVTSFRYDTVSDKFQLKKTAPSASWRRPTRMPNGPTWAR